jgi:hypothetical protein
MQRAPQAWQEASLGHILLSACVLQLLPHYNKHSAATAVHMRAVQQVHCPLWMESGIWCKGRVLLPSPQPSQPMHGLCKPACRVHIPCQQEYTPHCQRLCLLRDTVSQAKPAAGAAACAVKSQQLHQDPQQAAHVPLAGLRHPPVWRGLWPAQTPEQQGQHPQYTVFNTGSNVFWLLTSVS